MHRRGRGLDDIVRLEALARLDHQLAVDQDLLVADHLRREGEALELSHTRATGGGLIAAVHAAIAHHPSSLYHI